MSSQGGVLSSTLFLIFIDDIIKELPRGVRGAIYADNLVLWYSEEYYSTTQVCIHSALDKIAHWTESWLVSLNESNTICTIFSLSNKKQKVKLALKGMVLKEELTPTYLGVTFNWHLTWKEQINKSCTRAKLMLSIRRNWQVFK
jgi:hypothetical protein